MASFPYVSTTRRSSPARSSVSSSQDTATNSSAPRCVLGPDLSRSHPRRTAGVAMREECRIEPGRLPSSGDGSVSPSSGATEAMSPDSMSTEKPPQ
jgi:hypothetical protein